MSELRCDCCLRFFDEGHGVIFCNFVAPENGERQISICDDCIADSEIADNEKRLEAELTLLHRKASHGCYNFSCPECDGGDS